MLKRVHLSTAVLIKENLINKGLIYPPFDEAKVEIAFDWFDNEEISLSNAKADGEKIDEGYFENVCIAANDLLATDEEDVDIQYLNQILAMI